MDRQEIEQHAGVIENFLEGLPEKMFHLGIRVVLAALAFLIGMQVIKLIRHILKKALNRSRVDESAVSFIDSFIKFGMYFVLYLPLRQALGWMPPVFWQSLVLPAWPSGWRFRGV